MALGRSSKELDAIYKRLAKNAKEKGVVGKMSIYHQEAIDSLLSTEKETAKESIERLNATGRLGIGTTEFWDKHTFHYRWDSLQELYDCCHGSFHIPLYCAYDGSPCVEWVKGRPVVDGAFSVTGDDLPDPNDTLWVGVSATEQADIYLDMTRKECAFPLEGERYEDVKRLGREAVLSWARQTGSLAPHNLAKIPTIPKRGLGAPNWPLLAAIWILRLFERLVLWMARHRHVSLAALGAAMAAIAARQRAGRRR